MKTGYREPLDTAPVPVVIQKTPEELSGLAVEFGATQYFNVPLLGSGPPVQILQRRPTRYKAVINIPTLVFGLVTSGFAPSQVVLAASGTPAFNNNPVPVTVNVSGGTVSAITVNGNTTGVTSGNIVVPAGGNITITYTGPPTLLTFVIPGFPTGGVQATSLFLAYRPELLSNANAPQGYQVLTAPHVIQWENQQPCYAAATGTGGIVISVIDQAQAATGAVAEELTQELDYTASQAEGERYDLESGSGNEY